MGQRWSPERHSLILKTREGDNNHLMGNSLQQMLSDIQKNEVKKFMTHWLQKSTQNFHIRGETIKLLEENIHSIYLSKHPLRYS